GNNASNQPPKPKPDARVKLSTDQKKEVARRVRGGETQTQVAADYGVSQRQISNVVAAAAKVDQQQADREARVALATDLQIEGFHLGDFRAVARNIPDDTVDLVFADPPYDRESLTLYGDLARIAAAKLVEGGSLVCYLGQYQIDKVLEL